MNIAIVGAGLSGLACAYELKRHGIIPTVFDKKKYIGQGGDFNTCTLKMFDRSIINPIAYLDKKYGIKIESINPLKEIIMNSPSHQTIVRGNLGSIFHRGEHKGSLESQLANIANIQIDFESDIRIEKIKNEFDYVIVSTGDSNIAKSLNVCKPTFNGYVRIASVKGNFNTNSLTMWVNTKYCKKCFIFLLPNNEQEACLALCVNDIHDNELDEYWERFITEQKINYKIIKTADVEHNFGFADPLNVDNIYFTGKAAGFIDSVLGFGSINAIESGILLAKSLIEKKDYKSLVAPIVKDLKKKYEFRKTLDTFENEDFDKFIKFLDSPVLQKLTYNNPFYKATQSAFIAKIYNGYINRVR